MIRWHLLSAEYPPRVGGVSDYTSRVASALADAGDEVHVWCTPAEASAQISPAPGVAVHRVAGAFSPADLRRLGASLDRFPFPRRLLVQWVPHSYGLRSLNLAFCLWLLRRSLRGDEVEVMVHEPGLPFSVRHWRWNLPALVHRLMTLTLLAAARRIWVSAPEWADRWRRYDWRGRVPFAWLPLPNGIPVVADDAAVQGVRDRLAPGGAPLLGYFGLVQGGVGSLLLSWIPRSLALSSEAAALIIGKGSEELREELIAHHPELEARIHATGVLSIRDVSLHLQACDLLIQPYPGGVNARRSSVVAGLGHGRVVVSTRGEFTEGFWSEREGVVLVAEGDAEGAARIVARLLGDAGERRRLAGGSSDLYSRVFALSHTVELLRSPLPR